MKTECQLQNTNAPDIHHYFFLLSNKRAKVAEVGLFLRAGIKVQKKVQRGQF